MVMRFKNFINFWLSDASGTRIIRSISHLRRPVVLSNRPMTKGARMPSGSSLGSLEITKNG